MPQGRQQQQLLLVLVLVPAVVVLAAVSTLAERGVRTADQGLTNPWPAERSCCFPH